MAPKVVRDDLVDLEDRLLDEGFQFLLSILPQNLFELSKDGIIALNESIYPSKGGPCYGYARKQEDAPDGIDVHFCRIYDAEITAFKMVPPLAWYGTEDSDYLRSSECRDHAKALINYFLLLWASNQPYDGPLWQPNYKHLVAALDRLMTTHHYQRKAVIHEDADRTDVQMNFRYLDGSQSGNETHPSPVDSEKDDVEAGYPSKIDSVPRDSARAGTRLLTPHQSPKHPMLDVSMVYSAEDLTRETSVASANDSAGGAELAASEPLDTDVVMTLATEELVRQSLPTPDTLMEEAIAENDPTLRDLQKKLGFEPSSHLPDLQICTFKKIHTSEPGFLSLRLLLGKLQDPPSSDLDGAELWASFKMHDRNDRAAPRMHVHAFDASTDYVISDDLKIKDILPYLKPGAAFTSISPGGDRAEELLLKALVKYYYIIAARDKLLGFDKHKMPYNDSFADQLKIAVKRLQTHEASRTDEPTPRRPYKRLKRSHNPTPTAALSDAEDDSLSFPRTRDARRSGRRTGQPSSTAVSDSEDNVPGLPSSIPRSLPRRLALGVPIRSGMEAPAVNEFLDPDAEPADSDGESGDEIPGPISADLGAFLQKRHDFQRQAKVHYEITKAYAKKKEGAIMGIRKVKGMLKKHDYEPEVRARQERDLANRHLVLQAMQTHLAMREEATVGWKKRAKEMEAEVQAHPEISPNVLQMWSALYRRDDY
ncbi:hypothetical protein BU23DRAFT_558515 [Bimuria novae-zelandiae CBS 107.79]|uniref:Uncharacterized protein n=1 Tax=Bimuria novae-zelandiae CBS 107.79 TaxID=1447943 RepID=A0A6A5UUI9_9PLEO|nr:hypothetical protein BU23DRAFT_558515 [Bimuria novae-zelandiae CBS 107.79]